MSKDPLQSCKIETDGLTHGVPKTLELGVGGRKLIYGPGVRPRIEIPTDQHETELQGLNAEVVAALALTVKSGEEARFVTVGADHALVIWNVHGIEQRRMAEHTRPVLGVWEFSDGSIASWSEARRLIVWLPSDIRIRIPARAGSFEHLPFVDGRRAVCVPGWFWTKRIVQLETGAELAKFRGQSEPLTDVHQLDSGLYVTVAASGMKLRSARGELIAALPKFSPSEGYLSFSEDNPRPRHFQIVDEAHALHLLAATGERRGSCAADEPLANALRAYIKSHASALKAIEGKPSLATFGFRHNPLCDLAAVGGEGKTTPRQRLWSFFYRPRHARIQSWLLAETKVARDLEQRVASARAEHERRATLARRLTRLASWMLGAAVAVLLGCTLLLEAWPGLCLCREPSLFWSARFLVVACLGASMWLRNEHGQMRSGAEALSALPHHIAAILLEIAQQRAQLRAALPGAALYRGDSVRKIVDKRIASLRRSARRQWQLQGKDLITPGRKALVLRDWSLLARAHNERSTPHLEAFWWTKDGALWLAVERVHVVLPTRHRLYIYRADYDYIEKTACNEERHVVHYADVVDIIIRDKRRSVTLCDASVTVSARELVLVAKSGETITLCALDQHSGASLYETTKAAIGNRLVDMDLNLATEHAHSLPAHQPQIEAERAALEAEKLTAAPIDENRSDVDEVFRQISSLILGKPKPVDRRDRSWPKLHSSEADLN